jgi:hypothetical protein
MRRKCLAGYLVSYLMCCVFRYIAVARVVQQDTRPYWDCSLLAAALGQSDSCT